MRLGVGRARPRAAAWASSEEARAFLQERLALFGKSVFLITAGFSTAANLASIGLPTFRWSDWISTANNWITWSLALDYLALWLICRRGRLPERTLAAIDAAAILLSSLAISFVIFHPIPGELVGGPFARMIVTVILILVTRAVIVPSSPRRTFVISLAGSLFPVAANYIKSRSELDPFMAGMQAVFTFLWFFAAVVVATLASRVIFGLRQQVREAA